MSGTPILLNGRHYSIAAGLVEALKPDYDGKTLHLLSLAKTISENFLLANSLLTLVAFPSRRSHPLPVRVHLRHPGLAEGLILRHTLSIQRSRLKLLPRCFRSSQAYLHRKWPGPGRRDRGAEGCVWVEQVRCHLGGRHCRGCGGGRRDGGEYCWFD